MVLVFSGKGTDKATDEVLLFSHKIGRGWVDMDGICSVCTNRIHDLKQSRLRHGNQTKQHSLVLQIDGREKLE
jgi:hypothetical protein